jgi:hypothetical protein
MTRPCWYHGGLWYYTVRRSNYLKDIKKKCSL